MGAKIQQHFISFILIKVRQQQLIRLNLVDLTHQLLDKQLPMPSTLRGARNARKSLEAAYCSFIWIKRKVAAWDERLPERVSPRQLSRSPPALVLPVWGCRANFSRQIPCLNRRMRLLVNYVRFNTQLYNIQPPLLLVMDYA